MFIGRVGKASRLQSGGHFRLLEQDGRDLRLQIRGWGGVGACTGRGVCLVVVVAARRQERKQSRDSGRSNLSILN